MSIGRHLSAAVTILLLGVSSAAAQMQFQVVHAFDPTTAPLSGYAPSAPPVVWVGGLYGTTLAGGTFDRGTVYKLTTSGLTTIHHFSGADGAYPLGALAIGLDGRLYGTTYAGGAADRGTIFRISVTGEFQTLHSFTETEGSNPSAGVILASDGLFWGTTKFGGTEDAGTAFKITHAGAFTQMRSFADEFNTANLRFPNAALIQASDGNLYGTTFGSTSMFGGSVYRLTLAGGLTAVTTFSNIAPLPGEAVPRILAGVVEGLDGWLYGGACCGASVHIGGDMPSLFRVNKAGTDYDDLYRTSTVNPLAILTTLALGSDGALYGASSTTLFSIDGAGTRINYKELAAADGTFVSGMKAIAPGWFIGSAYRDGPAGGGTIFLFRPY